MPSGVIESLDHEARGITRLDGKTIFVEGALPGETVETTIVEVKKNYARGKLVRIVTASPDRVRTWRCWMRSTSTKPAWWLT